MFEDKKEKSDGFVAFRRHIYKGQLFEIGDELPEGMIPGYGFRPIETDDIELDEISIKKTKWKKSK